MNAPYALDGCHGGPRTAALSGVPLSTIYEWARRRVVVPSISTEREKLWSFADLMALRIASWLRRPLHLAEAGRPGTTSRDVRDVLLQLDRLGLDPWDDGRAASLYVDLSGKIIIVTPDDGHVVVAKWLDLLGPFEGTDHAGPDLRRPRDHLRIFPGKCGGEPHLNGSRLTTIAVAALADRGYSLDDVSRLYPDASRQSLAEAIEFERSLDSSATDARRRGLTRRGWVRAT